MEQNNKKQADEGSPLKEGDDDDDVVGPQDQIVKVDITNDVCKSQLTVLPPKVIGEIGVWQVEKSLIVFLVSIPGLAQIFLTAFLLPKIDFWCDDSAYADVDNETLKVSCCKPT